MNPRYKDVVGIIRSRYGNADSIPLHAPVFAGNEKRYLCDCIDSTFVSSVGEYVDRFETLVREFIGVRRAIAVVNGTNGIHLALKIAGVDPDTEVVTQALTFVATCNAVYYAGAVPVFVDVDRDTMGMSPTGLEAFLNEFAQITPEGVKNKLSGRRISAIMPMHTFGHPVRIQEIDRIAKSWGIPLIEDAAESIGSRVGGEHTGCFGSLGVLSFNGNKTITTGGGGMIVTNVDELGVRAKHLSTTAKVPSRWDFYHDALGYNYRMPNINAALGCAQMEKIRGILADKRATARYYEEAFRGDDRFEFFREREGTQANYWLNALVFPDREERDRFLEETNSSGVQTRPIWTLMTKLPMNRAVQHDGLENSRWLEDRVVNIPSGPLL